MRWIATAKVCRVWTRRFCLISRFFELSDSGILEARQEWHRSNCHIRTCKMLSQYNIFIGHRT